MMASETRMQNGESLASGDEMQNGTSMANGKVE